MNQENLFDIESDKKPSGPVECLGMTFESDEARRAHFTDLLRDKLKDPEFRAIEGFPIGTDEAILELSDPPYHTACPNPWLNDFISIWEKKKTSSDTNYHREPFAADVSEGKTDAYYRAHSYHTKVPHKAIMRYLLHYTNPGDIVFDGFCGSGMTAVASRMCQDRELVSSMGYTVEANGDIYLEQQAHSKLGKRNVIVGDLSPAATFIASKYNNSFNSELFDYHASEILDSLFDDIGWMYETVHDENTKGLINYVVWSDVFICSECEHDIVFLNEAFDRQSYKVKDSFVCKNCSSEVTKNKLDLSFESKYDAVASKVKEYPKRVPVLINYTYDGQVFEKEPDLRDFEILEKIDKLERPLTIPHTELPEMQMANVGRMKSTKTDSIDKFFLPRQSQALGLLWSKVLDVKDFSIRQALLWVIEQSIPGLSTLNRYQPIMHGRPGGSQVNRQMSGVFYVPSQISECSPWYNLKGKVKRVAKVFANVEGACGTGIVTTSDCSNSKLMDNSIDYIFTDPPFGENIYYSDLNFLVESFHKVSTNFVNEAIIDRVRNKELLDYQRLMENCFKEYYRVLKPGKWITIEFSNTKAAVWNGIQHAINKAGFVISNVSALDKKQGTFQAVNSPTAVKQDLVISAYKPDDGFISDLNDNESAYATIWDFIKMHMEYLPVVKFSDNCLEVIRERDPRILYDRVVSYYVQRSIDVPLSSSEFQSELSARFIERDGMFFLPEQVAEYDRKRSIAGNIKQLSIFVDDEASAIDWIRQELKEKPKTYSEIHPLFLNELSGWKKNELELELSTLLEQNFIKYDGKDEVPAQIHTYLSTNFKDMRGLDKSDPKLVAKAKDRWYVPDSNKAADLEKIRIRALLKEFETYKAEKKKIKQPRAEALRAGFNTAWEAQDFQTILDISAKIPPAVLQEDEKLLMFYDNALTLTSTEDDEW
ncbi:DNA methyltransferase [Providencia manganoxydans]|uniref:DNA methyltransferase n=1 Tax=Providencia manganoxydans TaxID=2923283 RepID=UPI0032DB1501